MKALQEAGLEPSTIRTRFTNVRSVIRAAVRDRFLARDVTDPIRVPRQRKASAAMQIPSTTEVGAVMRACNDGDECARPPDPTSRYSATTSPNPVHASS